MCSKCWKHTVWCDKAVYPPYDDGHLDQFFFIYDCFQDLVVKYTIMSHDSCEVHDLAKVDDPDRWIRSRLKLYDLSGSTRSSKIWFFSYKILKLYDHNGEIWWSIIKSLWSYSFILMIVEIQNLWIVYFPQNERMLSVFGS